MTFKGEGSRVGIMFHKPKSLFVQATQLLLLGIKADGNPHVLPTISYVELLTLRILSPVADARAEGIKLRKGRENWFTGLCDDYRPTNALWKLESLSIYGDHHAGKFLHKGGLRYDGECETPCTYTECILSAFLSGIPSVYVTGGYTVQRWTSVIVGHSNRQPGLFDNLSV